MESLKAIWSAVLDSLRDLLPIILVIGFFQFAVLQQPIPNLGEIVIGIVFVVIGLTLFVQGLNMSLFPIGESMAYSFASKGSLFWLLCFAFSLGFGTTIAEPALIAVASEAAVIAANGGMIEMSTQSMDSYALGLRITVAISVGIAIMIGVFRIIMGWPIQYLIVIGYTRSRHHDDFRT